MSKTGRGVIAGLLAWLIWTIFFAGCLMLCLTPPQEAWRYGEIIAFIAVTVCAIFVRDDD